MLDKINTQDIVKIAKNAGKVIMQIYDQDFDVEYKQDKSPLTIADTNANKIIEYGLNQLSVDFPILSEEGVDIPYEQRQYWEYFWLVDPLDGTKEFNDAIETNRDKELISIGSSLKICLVAEGEADIYPRLGPTMEWDTGAAHAIIDESFCSLSRYTKKSNNRHTYNKPSLLSDYFVVSCAQV